VLKVNATSLPPATIADSDKLEVGDVVLAIGNPFGVGQTVTMGIVSGKGRNALGIAQYEDFIQTDASINMGNSGGALVDAEGRLVGINTAIFSMSGGNQGSVRRAGESCALCDGPISRQRQVRRGYLGIGLQPEISSDLAQEFKLPSTKGAMAAEVVADSPAAKAGFKEGDVVVEFNGKQITGPSQFRLMIFANCAEHQSDFQNNPRWKRAYVDRHARRTDRRTHRAARRWSRRTQSSERARDSAAAEGR